MIYFILFLVSIIGHKARSEIACSVCTDCIEGLMSCDNIICPPGSECCDDNQACCAIETTTTNSINKTNDTNQLNAGLIAGITITSFMTTIIIITIIIILIIACNKSLRERFIDSSIYKKCCSCLREKDPKNYDGEIEYFDDIYTYDKPITSDNYMYLDDNLETSSGTYINSKSVTGSSQPTDSIYSSTVYDGGELNRRTNISENYYVSEYKN